MVKKRSFHWLIWAGVVICAAAVIFASAFWMLGGPNGWKLSGLLQDALSRDAFDSELTLSVSSQDINLELQTELFRRTSDDLILHGITVQGIPICFSNQRIIFDNGRAFDLGEMLPQGTVQMEKLLKMLPFAGVKTEKQGADTVYVLNLDASKLQMLFADLPDSSALTAEFTEHDGAVSQIQLHLSDETRQAELTLCFVPERQRELSQQIWNAITAQGTQSLEVFSPLAKALMNLSATNPMGAQLQVTADCGPVGLTDTMMLYGTDSGFYLQRGDDVKPLHAVDYSDQTLLVLGYKFCRDGRFNRVGDSGSYSLTIPSESIKAYCVEMLPEIEMLPITYADGSLLFEVKDNVLSEAKMDVSGQMPFLLTTIDISLGARIQPVPSEQIVLPENIA